MLGYLLMAATTILPRPFELRTVQGEFVNIELSEQQCQWEINIFGKSYRCSTNSKIIVGIDFKQEPGRYPVTIVVSGQPIFLGSIVVTRTNYPTSYWIARKVKRSLEEDKKRKEERNKEAIKIVEALTSGINKYPTMHIPEKFRLPLKRSLIIKSQFGTTRIYRIRERKVLQVSHSSYHRGVDLKASYNTRIYAIGDGVVTCAEHFSKEGNMVIIYHGDNVYSLYLHLRRIRVTEGQKIKMGKNIGLTGDTGASRGPHLHFAVKINGAVVDPLKLVEQFR
jgi:hypothetical protein